MIENGYDKRCINSIPGMEPVWSPAASTGYLVSRYHKQCWVDSHAEILAPDSQGFRLNYDLKRRYLII